MLQTRLAERFIYTLSIKLDNYLFDGFDISDEIKHFVNYVVKDARKDIFVKRGHESTSYFDREKSELTPSELEYWSLWDIKDFE
jgi:hypothetical protein